MCSATLPGGIQVAFYNGNNLRRADATFAQLENDFNEDTFANDIAILQFANVNTFPLANVIRFSVTATVPTSGTVCALASFGFTAPDSTGPIQRPVQAPQSVAVACTNEDLTPTDSHFCARDAAATAAAVVCPGDNGSGLFVPGATPAENELVSKCLFANFIKARKFKKKNIYFK